MMAISNNKNKGFSLIEVIITVAIMAVVAGGVIGIYSWSSKAKLSEATDTVKSDLNLLRTSTLGKSGEWKLTIKDVSGEYVIEVQQQKSRILPSGVKEFYWNVEESSNIGSKVKIYSIRQSDSTKVEIDANYYIEIQYNKSNSSFSRLKCINSSGGDFDISGITISGASRDNVIKFAPLTGRYYTE